ncbi:glycosyltransferase [Catellatospora sp. KI3]|uniref:glycosyltransferase family 2 protein n=1 Tax=Catellatospora sp. KI3 TaxID=3041620 RepID=UPI002482120D|nr:glycosyltransferase family 2 protein [Catellatospora sp. KI3]MDI1460376.1 glycosyltransferase [Catellatospora sp. KI3]
MKTKANAGRFRDTRPAAPGAAPGWAPVPQQTPIPRDWPTVGVVIPTRDRPELLRRTLAAVRAQDYPGRLRVIVVFDQAEPDWRLADDADHPVMVLANWRQPGLAGARNTGIMALDTELVAFCDDDDVWHPSKLRRQVDALVRTPGAEFATCAVEVEFEQQVHPRLAGTDSVTVEQLSRSRMSMLHSSGFLALREALLEDGVIGQVAEDAPGSQNEDWDLLLRAARRHPIVHVDEPLVRVLWGRSSFYAYEYTTKISSLRWMMARHPEISGCRPGAARVYGQLACWSAAAGDRKQAWRWTRETVRNNWREPRAAIALAAIAGAVKVETVLTALHRRGHGI